MNWLCILWIRFTNYSVDWWWNIGLISYQYVNVRYNHGHKLIKYVLCWWCKVKKNIYIFWEIMAAEWRWALPPYRSQFNHWLCSACSPWLNEKLRKVAQEQTSVTLNPCRLRTGQLGTFCILFTKNAHKVCRGAIALNSFEDFAACRSTVMSHPPR